jgi:hypothetical protein
MVPAVRTVLRELGVPICSGLVCLAACLLVSLALITLSSRSTGRGGVPRRCSPPFLFGEAPPALSGAVVLVDEQRGRSPLPRPGVQRRLHNEL